MNIDDIFRQALEDREVESEHPGVSVVRVPGATYHIAQLDKEKNSGKRLSQPDPKAKKKAAPVQKTRAEELAEDQVFEENAEAWIRKRDENRQRDAELKRAIANGPRQRRSLR